MTADVFISYRGADRVLARKLENRLRSRWGSRVFRDESGLMAGRSWADELGHAMKNARVMLALVGPGWQVATNAKKEDWVRTELATAIDGATPILPVLVGNPDELRPKLGNMPEAFQRQAVVVGPELAGFDLHKVATALRRLGAFSGGETPSLSSGRDELLPEVALARARAAIEKGKSVLIVGTSGSGRNALVRQLVRDLEEWIPGDSADPATAQLGHLVATHGLQRSPDAGSTHAVIASWIRSLSETFQDLNSPFGGGDTGKQLVRAVLRAGPDLLSRRVVRASTLLPLGDASHDQRILNAVRRPTDRWAPFPPTRLMYQSRGVLEALYHLLQDRLATRPILVVDHFDSIDSVSADLVENLLNKPIGRADKSINLVIAAYDCGPNARGTLQRIAARAMSDTESIELIDINDTDAWGEKGNNLRPWLTAHAVELAPPVADSLADDPNPYRVLSKLWYLVDNGYVSEKPNGLNAGNTRAENDRSVVVWQSTQDDGSVPDLTDDCLLDHMVSEHIPIAFRRIVEAGALIGRSFPFLAAYFAAKPPTTDAPDEDDLSNRESKRWLIEANQVWSDMTTIDPDHSVLSCYLDDRGEKVVSLAQADLIGHLRNQIDASSKRLYHERLARYLVDPVEEGDAEDLSFRHHNAELAATHWGLAERPRDAADAHRRAAEIAERSLAYSESQRNYKSAIRLYTQLLADRCDPTREHEDLLILANCLYRVGQATRLLGQPGKACGTNQRWGARDYLEQALGRLNDLKTVLLDEHAGRWPDGVTGAMSRDIPGPNMVCHHTRLHDALSGHVHLELAQCHQAAVSNCPMRAGDELHSCESCETHERDIRARLFDALRHAEAARGEAGSRWLLAAASARLAALLTDEALRARRNAPDCSHNLAVEAFYHIERIIGLRTYGADEKRDLSDAVAWAWRSAGRLFRHQACEPRIALWAFRKMNDHGDHATTAVDMATDRWLGVFLLSICGYNEKSPLLDEARALLERYRDWVTESGLVDSRTPAHLRLYLLELLECGREGSAEARDKHLRRARRHAGSAGHRRDCALFEALEIALEARDITRVTAGLADKFREALGLGKVSDEDALLKGWTKLAGMLVRRCPYLAPLVQEIVEPVLPTEWADHDSELRYWAEWARRYVDVWHSDPCLRPSLDCGIERLALTRLPKAVREHAHETAVHATRLLDIHAQRCVDETGAAKDILRRDLEYAAHIHDWYLAIDPARMLTLASEWNLPVSGAEWSNPKLLHGRLAVTALKEMYSAQIELGTDRFRRISAMAENHTIGRPDATALEKLFFLADALSDSITHRFKDQAAAANTNWGQLAHVTGKLDQAYAEAVQEKELMVRNAGHVVVSRVSPGIALPLEPSVPPETDKAGKEHSLISVKSKVANQRPV